MSSERKRYEEVFKKQIVELMEQGKSVSEISREYGIRDNILYRWKKTYGVIGKTPEGEVVTVAEHRKLQKRVAQLELENEILKKATAIFARKTDLNSSDNM